MPRIVRLYLRNFRNYERAEVDFSSGLNQIQGDNGEGKTNLLEALFLIGTGRSFRTERLAELIAHGKPFFYLEAEFVKDGFVETIKLSFDGQSKKLSYNNTSYVHFTPLLGLLPTVLFAPEDAALVAGSPDGRRRFLDLHIAQADPLYIYHAARYYKAMKQRNCLLRERKTDAIESWEAIMTASALYIQAKRKELLDALAKPAAAAMRLLSEESDDLSLSFEPSLIGSFAESRAKEMVLGATLKGPHRDDFLLMLGGKMARLFASQGQKRCIAASLRLAEKSHFEVLHGSSPLFGIDDFGVHLDAKRSAKLLQAVSASGQVFLTSPQSPSPEGRVVAVRSGEIACYS